MKKTKILCVIACSVLALFSCSKQEQTSSPSSSENTDTTVEPSSEIPESSDPGESSTDSESSSEPEVDPEEPEEEKVITITPTNVKGASFIEMNGVAPNATYTTEFTMAKGGNSYMASSAIKKVTRIVTTVYGKYDNLVMYDAVSGGNVVTAVSASNAGYKSAVDYTYTFEENTDEWRLANPSSYDVNLYAISIYYLGEIDSDTPFLEEDGKIDINYQTYAKHSKLTSSGVTDENKEMVFAPNAYVKADNLDKVTTIQMVSGSPSFSVYAVNGEEKTKIDPEYGTTTSDADYAMGDSDGFLIINETNETITARNFIVSYEEEVVIETKDVTIAEAKTAASSLSRNKGTSTDYYRIKGTVSTISGSTVTLTDGTDSIVCYSSTTVENMYPKYQVTVIGQLQNYYGTPEVINYSVSEYVPVTYSITVEESEHGTFTVSKTSDIAYGEKVTITCQPEEGYEAKKALVGGKAFKISDNTVEVAVTDDCTASVTFGEISEETAHQTTADYMIADYPAGEQYADETHTLDDNTSVEISKCYWTTELRIYSSETNNGTAIIHSVGDIKSISMNLGNAADVLDVYGSEDGETYTLITTITTTAEYADYEVTMPSDCAYHYIKLDVEGTNIIRMVSFSLTYEADSEGFVIHSLEMCGTYGDSNLIQYGNYDVLVDSGTASDTVNVRKMLEEYVTDGTLDLVIVSHPDSDHYAGITNGCLDTMDHVGTLITNNHHSGTEDIANAVKAVDPDVNWITASDVAVDAATPYTIEVDNLFSIDIMYNPGYAGTGTNNASIPAIFNFKNTKLFMGGDMEESACNTFIDTYPDLFSDDDYVIFKGLHHGSNGSNKTNFLEYLKPDMAFVNAPLKTESANNSPIYSTHPYLEAMERIGEVTPNLYWAGISGNLTIECDGYTSTAFGEGRSYDYYYYNKEDGSYTKVSREDEMDITFFESMWYKQAIENMGAKDYAHKWSSEE